MTDNEIIKSLECCCDRVRCSECYFAFEGGCDNKLKVSVLELINRQQAEIEICAEVIERQDKEIESLKKENKILSKNADDAFQEGLNEAQDLYAEQVKNEVKAEAIKEFADRLKGELNNLEYHENTDRKTVTKVELYNFVNWIMRDVVPNEIDGLVKEMEDSRA